MNEYTIEALRDQGIALFARVHKANHGLAVGEGPVTVRVEDGAAVLVVKYRSKCHAQCDWSEVQEVKQAL